MKSDFVTEGPMDQPTKWLIESRVRDYEMWKEGKTRKVRKSFKE